jgi:hypothetical protein
LATDPAARLRTVGDAIVAGVEAQLPAWAVRRVRLLVAAWGRFDADAVAAVERHARLAGDRAAVRVGDELRDLFATSPELQRRTPLEIVRTAVREPTAVLAQAGVPAIVRDEFDERAFPDDVYGLVPRTLGDLGDEHLGPLQLEWGLAKTAVLRSRAP